MQNSRLESTKYTQEEEKFVRENYGSMSVADIAAVINRSESSVRSFAFSIMLANPKAKASYYKNDIFALTRKGYTATAIAEYLGLSKHSVLQFCKKNGIRLKVGGTQSNKVILDENPV